MDSKLVAGLVMLAGGLAGYGVGVFVAYPGRAFSASAVMIGITLIAIGDRPGSEG